MFCRRHTIRLARLDYSLPNQFFVTICAIKHGCYFDKYPTLTKICEKNICFIKRFFPNLLIENYVIMPNHIHLIIEIKYQIKNIDLGKIIRVFKSKTINDWLKIIKKENLNCLACVFQRNYFEHVIRNKDELCKYINYIKNNPKNWRYDKYNPGNLLKNSEK